MEAESQIRAIHSIFRMASNGEDGNSIQLPVSFWQSQRINWQMLTSLELIQRNRLSIRLKNKFLAQFGFGMGWSTVNILANGWENY
jgi:hypothetical protein